MGLLPRWLIEGLKRAPAAKRAATVVDDFSYPAPGGTGYARGFTDAPLENPFPGHARPVLDPESPTRAFAWPYQLTERALQRSQGVRAAPDLWAVPAAGLAAGAATTIGGREAMAGGVDLEMLQQMLQQMQAGGMAPSPMGLPPLPPPPAYNNALFPSGGQLPDYGLGPMTQLSKMGLTPEASGSISGPAPRPEEYTAPLAEMTPPVIPGAGAIGTGLSAALRMARPAIPPMAAAAGMTAFMPSDSSSSESPLQQLYAQQKELADRRDAAISKRDQEGATGKGPRYQDADAEVRRLERELSGLNAMISDESRRNSPEYQMEMQRKADELVAEQKAKEAATPFRERYPNVAGSLPLIGLGLAAGLPFAAGAKKNLATFFPGSYPGRVASGIRRAEGALVNGDRDAMALSGAELGNLITAQPTTSSGLTQAAAAAASGGALTAEAGMFPEQFDAYNLPEGPERDAARGRALNPLEYGERAMMGTLTGLSGYKAGGVFTPSRAPRMERAMALKEAMENPALPTGPMGAPRLHHSNFQPRNRGQFAPGAPKYPTKK